MICVAIWIVKKTVTILGVNLELEFRVCANHGCEKTFWTLHTSKQSICSTKECFEIANGKVWFKDKMPKVRRPGEKSHPQAKSKGKKQTMRVIIGEIWNHAQAKRKADAKAAAKAVKSTLPAES